MPREPVVDSRRKFPERQVTCRCGAPTMTRHPTNATKVCHACLTTAHNAAKAAAAERRRISIATEFRTRCTCGRLAERGKDSCDACRRTASRARRINSGGPCPECYGLPWRRDATGCEVCGLSFSERPHAGRAESSPGCGLAHAW